MTAPDFDAATRTELEAAAFRSLVAHLRDRTDVQNIDLMNLAGFCRNCMSRWYREAAEAKGIALADPMPGKSSTACHTRNGRPNTKGKPRRSRRQRSPSRIRGISADRSPVDSVWH